MSGVWYGVAAYSLWGLLTLYWRLFPSVPAVLWLTLAYGTLPWIGLALAASFGSYGLVKKKATLPSLEGLTLETAVLVVPAALFLTALNRNDDGAFLHSGAATDLLLAAGGIVTVVPLLLFATAVRRVPLSVIGILQYIAPTIQFLLGVFAFHEPFTRTQLTGFGLVWMGLLVFTLDSVRFRPSPPLAIVDERAR